MSNQPNKNNKKELFRALPSTDVLLQLVCSNLQDFDLTLRTFYKILINDFLENLRKQIQSEIIVDEQELSQENILKNLFLYINKKSEPSLRPLINATGVVIHTNLGRSLLAKKAIDAVVSVSGTYSNLEFDLSTGARGTRYSHVEELLVKLTGAESALVVNNNAAAVFLVLESLCKNKEVIVSRGELVEIGGSFRIPEVMEKSGCILKEVGTTNRTHLTDFSNAINEQTGAILKVHTSNYKIIGFTSMVERKDLSDLAHSSDLPIIEDLGSGSFCNFAAFNIYLLKDEPTAFECIAGGVDVVTMSGDKVLGGPQAGIILGKKKYIDKIKSNPLNRALRIDKMTLAALEATLKIYLDPENALEEIPTLKMLSVPADELKSKALCLQGKLKNIVNSLKIDCDIVVREGFSKVGGGSFPSVEIPTTLVGIQNIPENYLKDYFLKSSPAIIGRAESKEFCLDPRTIDDKDFDIIANLLEKALINFFDLNIS